MKSMIILPNGVAGIEGDSMTGEAQSRGIHYDGIINANIIPLIKPGDWVVDAGAAIGSHSHAYKQVVGKHGHVFAFEPNPEFCKCMKHNCPDVILHEKALWNDECKLFLAPAHGNLGASCLDRKEKFPNAQELIGPIEAIRLDQINLPRLDFMKIDVEGSELYLLQGAALTLAKCMPKMVIEINHFAMQRYNLTPNHIYNFLQEAGYKWKSIRNDMDCRCKFCDILAEPR